MSEYTDACETLKKIYSTFPDRLREAGATYVGMPVVRFNQATGLNLSTEAMGDRLYGKDIEIQQELIDCGVLIRRARGTVYFKDIGVPNVVNIEEMELIEKRRLRR